MLLLLKPIDRLMFALMLSFPFQKEPAPKTGSSAAFGFIHCRSRASFVSA